MSCIQLCALENSRSCKKFTNVLAYANLTLHFWRQEFSYDARILELCTDCPSPLHTIQVICTYPLNPLVSIKSRTEIIRCLVAILSSFKIFAKRKKKAFSFESKRNVKLKIDFVYCSFVSFQAKSFIVLYFFSLREKDKEPTSFFSASKQGSIAYINEKGIFFGSVGISIYFIFFLPSTKVIFNREGKILYYFLKEGVRAISIRKRF